MAVNTLKEPHIVKVRKQHICQGCGKKIEIGEKVTSSTFVDSGEVYTFYECDICRKHIDAKCSSCSDFNYCIGEDYSVGSIKECITESNK